MYETNTAEIMDRGLNCLLKQLGVVESTAYVFVPALSWFLFHEPVSKRKVLAISMIVVGVIVFFL